MNFKVENKVLLRQLRSLKLSYEELPESLEAWRQLLERVQKSYMEGDQERYLVERSLQISSQEMKDQNEKLIWQSQLLAAQIDAMPFGILVVGVNNKILALNGKFKSLWNCKNTFVGSEVGLLREEIGHLLAEHDASIDFTTGVNMQSKEEAHWEIVMGEGKIIEISTNFLKTEGSGILGRLWTFRDISERKKLQETLTTASKFADLGQMAGGIAHEINNPLGTITARATHIKRLLKISPPDLEKIGSFAEIIEQTGFRIAAIVNGLKTFSRNADRDPFERSALSTLIKDALSLCAERFKNQGINLHATVPDNLEIRCRPAQFLQVLINLLNNSYDAIQDKDDKWVKIEVLEERNEIKILVTDSGQGIPEKIRHKIFQPFFTTKELGKGTGLGLSIVHGLVRDHGGSISVDTTHANTRFVVTLPKNSGNKSAA